MKKLTICLLAALFVINLSAQDDRPFRIGFSILPSSSWIKPEGKIIENTASKLGFGYGLLAEFNFGEGNYAFATGLMINSLGGTIRNSNFHTGDTSITAFGTVEEKYKLQYVQIPLTLKLKTNEIGYLTYFAQMGLDLGFNIKAEADYEGDFNGISYKEPDVNVSDDIQPIRSALNVGAGVEYNISGTTYLVASVAWNNGLTNLFKKKPYMADGLGLPLIEDGIVRREKDNIQAINNYLGLSLAVYF